MLPSFDAGVSVSACLPLAAPSGIAIALGANLGDPEATLVAVRPLVEEALLAAAVRMGPSGFAWSPRYRTAPVGGPPGQPPYLNAALLVADPWLPLPSPRELLGRLLELERRFGRVRRERWGPRRLDLDLLWCGQEVLSTAELELPHPRLLERSFVLAPLAAIAPGLVPPGAELGCLPLLERLLAHPGAEVPQRLPPQPGWPE
jgi:2-amino-4-hydroxy-6-hydroxymethyldihydropteridine diphosphokinase